MTHLCRNYAKMAKTECHGLRRCPCPVHGERACVTDIGLVASDCHVCIKLTVKLTTITQSVCTAPQPTVACCSTSVRTGGAARSVRMTVLMPRLVTWQLLHVTSPFTGNSRSPCLSVESQQMCCSGGVVMQGSETDITERRRHGRYSTETWQTITNTSWYRSEAPPTASQWSFATDNDNQSTLSHPARWTSMSQCHVLAQCVTEALRRAFSYWQYWVLGHQRFGTCDDTTHSDDYVAAAASPLDRS